MMKMKLDSQAFRVRTRLRKYYRQKQFTKTDVKAEIVSIKDAPLTLAQQDTLFDNLIQEEWIKRSQQEAETFYLTKKALDEMSIMSVLRLPLVLLRA